MVKPLAFKGDNKSKKRKAHHPDSSLTRANGDTNALTVQAATAEAEEDDSWVTAEAATDVTGPIIFALPSTKPTCIACDANGKIYISELENMIEGDLATAEPHDVRQVWIASRVAGTDKISFKGHHGRYVHTCVLRILFTMSDIFSYLSCDKIGVLSATRGDLVFPSNFRLIPAAS